MGLPPEPVAPPTQNPPWMGLPVFSSLPPEVLGQVVQALVPMHVPASTLLMEQDGEGDALFVLAEGSLQVEIRGADDASMARVLRAPAIVGEMALITGEPRSASVRALQDCHVLRMDKPVFAALVREHPQTAVFLTCLVGERLLENRGIRKVGKYQVMGRLGSGGVATVFEALHPGLGTAVALKMLSHSLVFDGAFSEHFGREGRLVAQLAHDNIVRVLDTEEAYGTRFIVMEKLSGELLEHIIQRGERLPWPHVRRIIVEVAEALAYSHSHGLIHRDIKPANVFMTDDKRVKLLDFGIAVQLGKTVDDDGRVIGTPSYMAPEQILGQELDGRSDIYALGILAYELCVHELPFVGATAQEVFSQQLAAPLPDPRLRDPDIPDDLVVFMRRACAKVPAQRFANCEEIVDFLQRASDATPASLIELSTLSMSYLPSRRAQVQSILAEAAEKLRRLRGVHVFAAHEVVDATGQALRPQAPGARDDDAAFERAQSPGTLQSSREAGQQAGGGPASALADAKTAAFEVRRRS